MGSLRAEVRVFEKVHSSRLPVEELLVLYADAQVSGFFAMTMPKIETLSDGQKILQLPGRGILPEKVDKLWGEQGASLLPGKAHKPGYCLAGKIYSNYSARCRSLGVEIPQNETNMGNFYS